MRLVMGQPVEEGQIAGRQRVLREYVLGGGDGCTHPKMERKSLGMQGASAFYQCQRCDAVVIITVGTAQPAEHGPTP